MALDLTGKKLEITQAWNSENIWVHQIGNFVWKWNSQEVYMFTWNNSQRVVKVLEWKKWLIDSQVLVEAWIYDIQSFHLWILKAVENTGVPFPKYWDVVKWVLENWNPFHGFIQSVIKDADLPNGWELPNVWQKDTSFEVNIKKDYTWSIHRRRSDTKEFTGWIFFDWDSYLWKIITWKKEDETFEEFYARIASTKID